MDLNRMRLLAGVTVTERPGLGEAKDPTPKLSKKLASSNSLEGLKEVIAEFYGSKPERITFTEVGSHWSVQSGEKQVTPIVIRQGKRFVFGVAETASVKESSDKEVADAILAQMGGMGRIRAMLGAKFIVIPNGVAISWPSKQRSKGNRVEITLQGSDTYDVEFFNASKAGKKSVKKLTDIYADALISTFESQTGYYLKMSAAEPDEDAQVEGVDGSTKLPFYATAKSSDGAQWFYAVSELKNGNYSGSMLDGGAAGRSKKKAKKGSLDAKWAKQSWEVVSADKVPPDIKAALLAPLGEAVEGCPECDCESCAECICEGCACEDCLCEDCGPAVEAKSAPERRFKAGERDLWFVIKKSKTKNCFVVKLDDSEGDWDYDDEADAADMSREIKGAKTLDDAAEILGIDESVEEAAGQTYAKAQQDIIAGLAKDGWKTKTDLKIPWALSPEGDHKLWFKAQAIYMSKGDQSFAQARSLHLGDIRSSGYDEFKADLARWTKESVDEEVKPSRAAMEKALYKAFPPDSKRKQNGKSLVMFTGDLAKAAGVLNYTSMFLSDLTDEKLAAAYALIANKMEHREPTVMDSLDPAVIRRNAGVNRYADRVLESVRQDPRSTLTHEHSGIVGSHQNWRLPAESEE